MAIYPGKARPEYEVPVFLFPRPCSISVSCAGPQKIEGDLPDYPGFEKDVYNTVTGYFHGQKEPLLTFSMFEVFTNVFGTHTLFS